jgi:hypothetical protein
MKVHQTNVRKQACDVQFVDDVPSNAKLPTFFARVSKEQTVKLIEGLAHTVWFLCVCMDTRCGILAEEANRNQRLLKEHQFPWPCIE